MQEGNVKEYLIFMILCLSLLKKNMLVLDDIYPYSPPLSIHIILLTFSFFFFFIGFLLLGLFVLVCIHSYQNKGHNKGQQLSKSFNSPNYYNHDHHAGEGLFVSAGSKKLQQSSVNLPDDEGVKFLPSR